MPWSSKNPLDKTGFIAPMDVYQSQKASQYIKSLKYYLKALYLNIEAL